MDGKDEAQEEIIPESEGDDDLVETRAAEKQKVDNWLSSHTDKGEEARGMLSEIYGSDYEEAKVKLVEELEIAWSGELGGWKTDDSYDDLYLDHLLAYLQARREQDIDVQEKLSQTQDDEIQLHSPPTPTGEVDSEGNEIWEREVLGPEDEFDPNGLTMTVED